MDEANQREWGAAQSLCPRPHAPQGGNAPLTPDSGYWRGCGLAAFCYFVTRRNTSSSSRMARSISGRVMCKDGARVITFLW